MDSRGSSGWSGNRAHPEAEDAITALKQFLEQPALNPWYACEEPKYSIHSAPESVDIGELGKMTLAEAYLLDLLGKAKHQGDREATAPKAVPAMS
ncbi:hypothetical protein [Kitasatospora sp. NBC_01300]|uniref:hypothetical protein n=1 Tax=Kitasatospora sp. NBC_01300 TaxID=2903574 RepID=UPI002F91045B|nr:hypothetical protein OG556_34985 [Kitasatospora sp. NBC_01300]